MRKVCLDVEPVPRRGAGVGVDVGRRLVIEQRVL